MVMTPFLEAKTWTKQFLKGKSKQGFLDKNNNSNNQRQSFLKTFTLSLHAKGKALMTGNTCLFLRSHQYCWVSWRKFQDERQQGTLGIPRLFVAKQRTKTILEIPLNEQKYCLILNERQELLTLQRWPEERACRSSAPFEEKRIWKGSNVRIAFAMFDGIREKLRAKCKHTTIRCLNQNVWWALGFITRIWVSVAAHFLPTRTR